MIPTIAAWLFCTTPKDSPRESQKFFEASTLRSLISLCGQLQTYLKNQKTRSRKRLLEESCTRSNVKIVIVFTRSDIARAKNTRQTARKGHSNIRRKFFVGQTPHASQSPNRFGERRNCWQVIGMATKTYSWGLAFRARYERYKRTYSASKRLQ